MKRSRLSHALLAVTLLAASVWSIDAHAEDVGTVQQCLYAGPIYDAIFRTGTSQDQATLGLSWSQFIAKDRELRPLGWRLRQMHTRVYSCNGRIENTTFDAHWRRDYAQEYAVYYWKAADFYAKNNELRAQGWRLTMMDGFESGGQIYYHAAWRPSTASQVDVYGWSWTDFVNKAQTLYSQGWTLHVLDTHEMPDHSVRYNASWRPGTDSWILGWSAADFDTKYNEMRAAGWNVQTMSIFSGGSAARYNVSWRHNSRSEIRRKRLSASQLQAEMASMRLNGYQMDVMEAYF
jgi:hypothetical protein